MPNFYVSLVILAILLSIFKVMATEVIIMDYSDIQYGEITTYDLKREDFEDNCSCPQNWWD